MPPHPCSANSLNRVKLTLTFGLVAALQTITLQAATATPAQLDRQFTQTIKPFLASYCVGCHSGTTPAAQFDVTKFDSMSSVAKDIGHWNAVANRVAAGEMPPKTVKQPSPEAKNLVVAWIDGARKAEARRNAGDPGTVLPRRLNNAEYDYTIRDLTGVDIHPAREFPVDPANTAGFDNSGESLTMSSALMKKYLLAAREVADHAALKPDGFDFAANPMLVETDREKYTILRIVDFYKSQPTDYADYFQAAWRYKNRTALGKPKAVLTDFATEAKISPKYIPFVWGILEEQKDVVGPVAKLQGRWKALPAPEPGSKSDPADLRKQVVAMRDFVVKIRQHTAMQFAAPKVRGLSSTSQPLMNWKLKQFASHRRNFDPATLYMADEKPPALPENMPKLAGLGQEAAVRWAAIALKNRVGDTDLMVPVGKRPEYEAAFARFANVFPDAFYISERGRFYPDDSEDKGRLLGAGYHNVMGYFRDDTPLLELILDDKGRKELDKLWDEFDYIADFTTRTYTQYYFNQSGEVLGNGRESGHERPTDRPVEATSVIMELRDKYLALFKKSPANDAVSQEAILSHFAQVDRTIRGVEKMRVEAEPKHLDSLLKFAARAYRRPLTKLEKDDLLAFYKNLREKSSLSHDEAIRDSIVSILMAPDFLYRVDLIGGVAQPGSNLHTVASKTGSTRPQPLSDFAIASRLSYLIWSSMPDDKLLAAAAAGQLRTQAGILAQTRRMLKDEKAKALSVEFAGNWLDYRRFEDLNSVDRERFPAFTNDLREAMYQEPIHFIDDMIRNDKSVLDLLYAKHTFVNPVLAKFYGIPADEKADPKVWFKVDDATPYGRGGILSMATFLTQNSPGLRTSPVKRGYWVARRVLGEVIPPPPPQVPELPKDEAASDLPLRVMLERHRANPACGACHARFDAFGLAFEGYGPVGNRRDKDMAGRPVDTKATFPGGVEGNGVADLKAYIHDKREKDYLDNIARKTVAFALGRSLQLSDELLIDSMKAKLASSNNKFSALVETLVTSPQFTSRRPADNQAPKSDKSKGALAYVRPQQTNSQQN